jgi:hypothetical protein
VLTDEDGLIILVSEKASISVDDETLGELHTERKVWQCRSSRLLIGNSMVYPPL